MKEDNSQSWVRISYGTIRYVNNYIKYNTQSLASPQEEEAEPASSEVIAARSKAKAKPQPRESSGTTTIPFNERIWIDFVPSKQDFDSHILSKRVINLLRHNQKVNREQDGAVQFYKIEFPIRDYSLSTQLVRWSMESLFGCRRRIQAKISVLLWLLGINHLSTSSSRTFWGQYHWSRNAGSCVDFTWNISLYLPCRKQFQYSFNSQQRINTWRSRIKQKTICVLLACWSKGWKSSRSREYWLLCTASCTILAKHLEKASGYGILDWYWSWNHQRRIEVLSNKIERGHPSRCTSTKLHCESWKIETRRTIV